jgi:SAM-dependent methyltransferase
LPERAWFAGVRSATPLGGGALYVCDGCGLKYRAPRLAPAHYHALYDNGRVENWASARRADWDRVVEYLHATLDSGATILDYGCNTGGLLARLGGRYRCFGIEINASARALAASRSAACVWPELDAVPAEQRFDAIVLVDVVEHLAAPSTLLRALWPRLAAHGVLIVTSGDGGFARWERYGAAWWYCAYAEHVAFISRVWLTRTAAALGGELRRCENFNVLALSSSQRLLEYGSAMVYGCCPTLYLFLWGTLLGVRRRRGEVRIPGAGTGADHLFVVLGKDRQADEE